MKDLKKMMAFMMVGVMSISFGGSISVSAQEDAAEEMTSFEVEENADGEFLIVDDENCVMKVTGIYPDGEWGYTWEVYLENKTDSELMFDMLDVSVNGLMCDPYWATNLAAGESNTEEVIWDPGEFAMWGIEDVTEVGFTLSVYDNEDWESGDLIYCDYMVYPEGKDAAVKIKRQSEETDKVLFDTDICAMTYLNFEEDGVWGPELTVYLENKSDKDLLISMEDVSVNGLACDPYWGTVVTAGNSAYAAISWAEEDLDINEITEFENIQGMIYVYDNDEWDADAYVEEEISIEILGE